MNAGPTKILVVDDSALYRQSIHNVLRDVDEATIVGTAENGVEALEKIAQLDPDLLTLDVQMPDMDGIQVLREIKRRRLRPKAIMVSSHTCEGAQVTTDALMEGAFDFILKPSSQDSLVNRRQLRDQLHQKITAFREEADRRRTRGRRNAPRRVAADDVIEKTPVLKAGCRGVILGCSTGGPEALKTVLSKIPAEFPAPVLVVQHMPAHYTFTLAKRLDEMCALQVMEAGDGAEVEAGHVLVAPGGRQMKLARSGDKLVVRIVDDPPEKGVRPAVDYLLRSACDILDGNALAVIMTGMGRDGVDGCRQLKEVGGYVFAQHQDDCVVYGMPKAVVEADLADRILPLGKIAPAIVRLVNRSRRS